MIWNRRHMADENIRQQNWLRRILRMKRRYGDREFRLQGDRREARRAPRSVSP